ncbi:MAG: hypothetical protein LBM70_03155 [Victivallales bacterium]|jgi:hypothetical protein|nr:hypothetical protein [Victivallales bacterium]
MRNILLIILTLGAVLVSAIAEEKYKFTANNDWIPLEFQRETVKGGAFDWSFFQDAPAGKYGWVKSSADGELTFENDAQKKLRLYGVNLCFTANFLDQKTVDKLAEELIYCGYNAVRIHHHDGDMVKKDSPDSVTLDPEKLAQLDYLLYRMKESGIYVTTDLYTNRQFRPGDGIPNGTMKSLFLVSDAALQNWMTFAKNWMTHRNPHTGLTWAEDPALFCVNLINEDSITDQWSKPGAKELFLAKFEEWKQKHNFPKAAALNSDRQFRRFLQELQDVAYGKMRTFLKEELKIRTMITSLNHSADIPQALIRSRHFDLVDQHGYWDHPTWVDKRWQLPYKFNQKSVITEQASMPRWMMPARIYGMPLIVTEFSYCNPNRYRAESGPVIGAYAALQNWSGLFRFAWSHGNRPIEKVTGGVYGFDAVNDPLARLSDRIGIMLFRRGDVSSAQRKIAWSVKDNFFDGGGMFYFPNKTFARLGLFSQIGSAVNDKIPATAEVITGASANNPYNLTNGETRKLYHQMAKQDIAESDTGEIRLESKRHRLTIVTERAETVTLNSDSGGNGLMKVRNAEGFQTLALLSLDGKPLKESNKMLLIQLTDIVGDGAVFDSPEKRILYYGGGHLLLLRRKAQIVLPFSPALISALNADGKVVGKIKGEFNKGEFKFTVDPGAFPGGVMAYSLTR